MINSQRYVDAPWRYDRIEGANHWMQLTAPDKLDPLLLDYLREPFTRTAYTDALGMQISWSSRVCACR